LPTSETCQPSVAGLDRFALAALDPTPSSIDG